ncbi:hypothetical protein [Vibrio comitans]|uniref:Uncharacterized protein n=1 Tax=Vibrio comitans NBRC 102076 TaxID=1219078 RepID=A0A4Y3ILM2_9VIBR|nr:hypothetical protein [Vibrio comitans]GEA60381.1 hypothetical protein VCO01S_15740 [Vibrio comitans NBRC 102076]
MSIFWVNAILYAVIIGAWQVYQEGLLVLNEETVRFSSIGFALLVWALFLLIVDMLLSKEILKRLDMNAFSKSERTEMEKPFSLCSLLKV